MKPRARSTKQEFERRLREARREVFRTVAQTDVELDSLEAHQPGAFAEDAANATAAMLLGKLEGRERHLLDEIAAAQARLGAGTFGACENCAKPVPLARLRALPTARLCIVCERQAEIEAARVNV
jgi:RNA polymerase-binding protein DksA